MKAATYPARVSDINLIHSATRNRWLHTLAFTCRDEYMTCRGKAESFHTVTQQYPKKHSPQWRSYRLRTAGVTAIELINMYVLDLVVCKQMITRKWNANETTRQERKTQWCLARISIGSSSTFSLCLRKAVCCTGVQASESNKTLVSSPENMATSDLNFPVPVLPSVPARSHERYNWGRTGPWVTRRKQCAHKRVIQSLDLKNTWSLASRCSYSA